MTEQSENLESLSLMELERACKRETDYYWRGLPSDSRFCLEIFRRALQRPARPPANDLPASVPPLNEAARTLLVLTYNDFIKATINRKAFRDIAIDDLTQQVWMHFWSAANQDKGLDFPSLEAALAYLRRVTLTTHIELQRRVWKHYRNVSLAELAETTGEDMIAAPDASPLDQYTRQRFHQRCREIVIDSLEWRIFCERYSMGKPPREIAGDLAHEGTLINGRVPTARSVSDRLERICRRLAQDREIRDLLGSD